MVSVISFILAAICNSIMDKCSHHFHKSIFSGLNPIWWNAEISWKNKYVNGILAKGRKKILGFNLPVQITDAWHFFKMLQIIFICLSIITYDLHLNFLLALFLYGTGWNVTFSLFYNKILSSKKELN